MRVRIPPRLMQPVAWSNGRTSDNSAAACSPVIDVNRAMLSSKTRKKAGGGRNGYFVASPRRGSGFESRRKPKGFGAQTVSTERNTVAFVPRPEFSRAILSSKPKEKAGGVGSGYFA